MVGKGGNGSDGPGDGGGEGLVGVTGLGVSGLGTGGAKWGRRLSCQEKEAGSRVRIDERVSGAGGGGSGVGGRGTSVMPESNCSTIRIS
jgi:hypothetical protein